MANIDDFMTQIGCARTEGEERNCTFVRVIHRPTGKERMVVGMFLTTNRPDVLDEAVLSRVMLRLNYPHLALETRAKIWQTMFTMAGLRLEGCCFERIARLDLNGRQIRNITRLAKILNPDGTITQEAMREALHFGCAVALPD